MNTSLVTRHPLPDKSAGACFEQAVHAIVRTVATDRIYLLGAMVTRHCTRSVFSGEQLPVEAAQQYCLLILYAGNERSCEIQDRLENRLKESLAPTILAIKTTGFAQWLETGHRFAAGVLQQAEILYDRPGLQLPPLNRRPAAEELAEAHSQYENLSARAESFRTAADLLLLRRDYKMALFMLHQATEFSLHAVLKSRTGFHYPTHNLDKLLRLCLLVSAEITTVFERHTRMGAAAFELLQRAYIDSRYKDSMSVTAADIRYISGRVQLLRQLSEQLCRLSPCTGISG
jgi:HEPN domain-containing protein